MNLTDLIKDTSFFWDTAYAFHGDIGKVQQEDIVRFIDKSGDSPERKVNILFILFLPRHDCSPL